MTKTSMWDRMPWKNEDVTERQPDMKEVARLCKQYRSQQGMPNENCGGDFLDLGSDLNHPALRWAWFGSEDMRVDWRHYWHYSSATYSKPDDAWLGDGYEGDRLLMYQEQEPSETLNRKHVGRCYEDGYKDGYEGAELVYEDDWRAQMASFFRCDSHKDGYEGDAAYCSEAYCSDDEQNHDFVQVPRFKPGINMFAEEDDWETASITSAQDDWEVACNGV